MSSNPDLCVDIFSQMGNLLSNFNINLGQASGFSQGEGFIGEENLQDMNGGSIEQTLNNNASVILIGILVILYALSQVASNSINQQARTNVKGRNNNSNNNE